MHKIFIRGTQLIKLIKYKDGVCIKPHICINSYASDSITF